jgi:hypothetical protein
VIKLIVTTNNLILISKIEEVGADIGEPNCKLIEPYKQHPDLSLTPFLLDYTDDDTFMVSSDNIFTMADPKKDLLKKYKTLTD